MKRKRRKKSKLPCLNCICIPICQNRTDISSAISLHNLAKKCSVIDRYIYPPDYRRWEKHGHTFVDIANTRAHQIMKFFNWPISGAKI